MPALAFLDFPNHVEIFLSPDASAARVAFYFGIINDVVANPEDKRWLGNAGLLSSFAGCVENFSGGLFLNGFPDGLA